MRPPTYPSAKDVLHRRRARRGGPAIVCALAFSMATAAVQAAAEPRLLGPEFPADDRPVPSRGWWTRCIDAAGTTNRLLASCDVDECTASDLRIERIDAGGTVVEPHIRPNEEPAVMAGFRLDCMPAGGLLVRWQDATTGCFLHRTYDADGRPNHDPVQTIPDDDDDCRRRADVATDPLGGAVATWTRSAGSARSRIVARRFRSDGGADGEVFDVADRIVAGTSAKPKVAVDASGAALVAWIEPDDGASNAGADAPHAIRARVIDRRGEPASDVLRLNTFAHGTVGGPAAYSETPGVFVVLWSNVVQGGRVGRRIVVDGPSATTTSTTTSTTVPEGLPELGAARTVTSTIEALAESAGPALGAGADRAWLVVGADGAVRRSASDGRSWNAPAPGPPTGAGDAGPLALAGDGAGAWVALHRTDDGDLDVARSTDDAFSWNASQPLDAIAAECRVCRLERAAVAGDAGGGWVAAWTVRTPDGPQVRVARSNDGGRRWRSSGIVAQSTGSGRAGFDIATDRDGAWILMWADADLWTARSDDGGARWTEPQLLARGVVCPTCSTHARFDRLDLASAGDGRWLAAFAAPAHAPERYGADADIFVVRSVDDGLSWSEPAPLAAYFEDDGARDMEPTVAVEIGAEPARQVVAWTSHRPRFGPDDMDADIVAVVSLDGGESWSPPAGVVGAAFDADADADAGIGSGGDSAARLAVSDSGVWMLAWKQAVFEPGVDAIATRTAVAVGEAECGDAKQDVGEQCDDGNRRSGDGCDANCTLTACGNGVPTSAEECDDANHDDQDRCLLDCRLAVCGDGAVASHVEECDDGNRRNNDACTNTCEDARCGDGHTHKGVEECDDGNREAADACTNACTDPRCGDGIVHDGEECDDGNDDELDRCLEDCTLAPPRCGDGHVDEELGEECDDGDDDDTDRCLSDCTRPEPRCGDGYHDEGEECDDGNSRNDDECVGECREAVCGDGYVNRGHESCDWGDPSQADICGPTCGIVDVCGDANDDGAVTVTDARTILLTASRLPAICPHAACDMDASGTVHVTDARMALAKSVGIDVGERCSLGTGWIVFWTDYDREPLGALSFDVEYGASGGAFRGSGAGVLCENLIPSLGAGTIPAAFNDREDPRILTMAFISIDGFNGPLDIVRCWFDLPEGSSGARLVIRTTDASTSQLDPVSDLYVGYRLDQ